jgi:hypothetical protein
MTIKTIIWFNIDKPDMSNLILLLENSTRQKASFY